MKITVKSWNGLSRVFNYPYKKRKLTGFSINEGTVVSLTFEVKE